MCAVGWDCPTRQVNYIYSTHFSFVKHRMTSGCGSYWLLVTRVSSFAKASGGKPHPPSRGARHPPPGIHPRKLCLRGARGRWALACSRHGDMLPTIWAVGNRPPRPNHPRKIAFSWGPVSRHPSIEGNFIPQRYEPSSPPLEGWRLAAGVVREYGFIHLLSCHSRAGGNKVY